MAEPLALKDQSGESQIFFDRMVVGMGLLVVLTLILVARLFYLQIIQHDVYATLSDKNRIQVQALPPTRGLIYDRNGELIADNIPTYNLTLIPELVLDQDRTIQHLEQIIGLDEDEVSAYERRKQRRQRPLESVPIRFRLSPDEIARISVDRYVLPGVQVEAELVRHYPKGDLMVHAVGSVRRINEEDLQRIDRIAYTGINHIGKLGVEKYYEDSLLGTLGYQRVEINARGQVMKVLDASPPVPGRNLTLHIDSGLQLAADKALGTRRGSVVAIDPRNGGILALVSKPAYDPNLFVTGIDYRTYASLRDSIDTPLFNRVLQGQYEPGSTLKPFIGLAGLAGGFTTPEYTIEDPGWFKLPSNSRLYRDWNWRKDGRGGHGEVNLEKALYRSCNTYFYELATRMGIEKLHPQLGAFGFGVSTAMDLPEARSGLLPSRQWKRAVRNVPWYPGDTVNIGIGQGDMLVTPLQLATAVSVLANRGGWVLPRMLREGSDQLNHSSVKQMADVKGIPDSAWELVIGGMEKVVHRGNQVFGENGTAWAYIGQDVPYRMAGKSGTAQVVGIAQGEEYDAELLDEHQRKHAWFIAFAPVDEPLIALAVLVENGGGGSSIAGPVAREILDYYLVEQAQLMAGQP